MARGDGRTGRIDKRGVRAQTEGFEMPGQPMPDDLHEAVRSLDVEAARALIAAGADVNLLDANGKPPLAYLFHKSGYYFDYSNEVKAMLDLLLETGASRVLNNVGRQMVEDIQDLEGRDLDQAAFRRFADNFGYGWLVR